ncbi:MAG: hypothetical protein K2G60_05490 [Oscillospiraceae bacterium]|nr:hypothetical protein [Oscillospiraceae bacterium]
MENKIDYAVGRYITEYQAQNSSENVDNVDQQISVNSDYCAAVCCDECCSCCRSMTYR